MDFVTKEKIICKAVKYRGEKFIDEFIKQVKEDIGVKLKKVTYSSGVHDVSVEIDGHYESLFIYEGLYIVKLDDEWILIDGTFFEKYFKEKLK